jgi:hypothetical protein
MARILFLALLLAAPLFAAESGYRIVHPDGTVEFTDQPDKGAEEIRIEELSTYPAQAPRSPVRATPSPTSRREPAPETGLHTGGYDTFAIVSPQEQETVFFNEEGMTVTFLIEPSIAGGHEVVLRLDGVKVAGGSSASFTLKNIYRGPHTLSASITNEKGEVLREAKPVTFFMRQHSIRNPPLQIPPLSPPPTTP